MRERIDSTEKSLSIIPCRFLKRGYKEQARVLAPSRHAGVGEVIHGAEHGEGRFWASLDLDPNCEQLGTMIT